MTQLQANERPTKTVELPLTQQQAVLKAWITGREQEYIDRPSMESVSIKPNSAGKIEFGEIRSDKIEQSTHRAIESIVVSVGGKTDQILDTVLDLPVSDYNVIIAEIQEMIKKK